MISHETACMLNASHQEARVRITIYFADRDPVGPYELTVAARRTLHVRFNDLTTLSPSRAAQTSPASWNPTCRWWPSTRGWIPGRRRTRS